MSQTHKVTKVDSRGKRDRRSKARHARSPRVRTTGKSSAANHVALRDKSSGLQERGNQSPRVPEELLTSMPQTSKRLPEATRTRMERAFGAEFEGVRLHDDSTADALTRALHADAFTVGRDIFFRNSAYSPGNPSGDRLLAHELTHVLQQSGRARSQLPVKGVSVPRDVAELEADQAADQILTSPIQGLHPLAIHPVDPTVVYRQAVAGALEAGDWIAAAALGYHVAQDAVKSSSGDISWHLDEMKGVLLPGGGTDVEKYKKANPKMKVDTKELEVSIWIGTEGSKKAGMKFGLAYATDGKAIGNISARVLEPYDWPLWGADCTVDLMPQTLIGPGGKAVVRVTLTISWDDTVSNGVDSGIWHLEGGSSFVLVTRTKYLWEDSSFR